MRFTEKRCPKCRDVTHEFHRCLCNLKNPKQIHCKKKHKYFLYSGWLSITWSAAEEKESTDLDIIWVQDIYDNPFKYAVIDVHDNYHNLSLAAEIYIIYPQWTLFHGDGKRCFCKDETIYLDEDAWIEEKK